MLGQVVDPGSSFGRGGGAVEPLLGVFLFVLTAVWFGGIGLIVLRFTRAWRRSEDLVTPVPAAGGDPVEHKLDRALWGTGIPRRRIIVAPGDTVPFVTGLAHPCIHLARSLAEALGTEELRAIPVHEDVHRRRREPLRFAVLSLASALFFFYPLVYLLGRRIREAAELICDDEVVRRGTPPEVYARALASTIRLGLVPAPSPVAAGMHSGSFLHVRFERIHSWRMCVMMPRHYLIMGVAVLLVTVGSLLPIQLLTGCARHKGSDTVAKRDGVAATRPVDNATPAVDASTRPVNGATPAAGSSASPTDTIDPPEANMPSPEDFVAVEEMPVLITPPQPVYPKQARLQEVEGVVTTRALIGREGKVLDCFAADGPELLRANAIEAVKGATFKPARQKGMPVAVWVQIPIRFSLH